MTAINVNTTPAVSVGHSSTILKTSDQYLSYLINGVEILARTSDGYVYVTAMCKAAGKQWRNYRKSVETEKFLQVASRETGLPISLNKKDVQVTVREKSNGQLTRESKTSYKENHGGAKALIEQVKGRYNKQGTWVHPDVAQHLARWLSPEIDYAVTQIVKAWTNGGTIPQQEVVKPALPGTITTITIARPGEKPEAYAFEDEVAVIPLEQFRSINTMLLKAQRCTTDFMDSCLTIGQEVTA